MIVYDIEVFPNAFTFAMEMLDSDTKAVWEISEYRDDRQELMEFFRWLSQTQTFMIGFNSLGYDYPIIHLLWKYQNTSYHQLYQKSQEIIKGNDRFGNMIWASDRFAPQIDLFKMHHLDNRNKYTSLKTLQINMRSPNVVEFDESFDEPISQQALNERVIPYNFHDVSETKRFAQFSKSAIDFRAGLVSQFGVEVYNWNDTKIGEQMVIQRLGDELCYDRSSGRRKTRQTPRSAIRINDIIFPYIQFNHPEFNRVLNYLRQQTLTAEDWSGDEDGIPQIKTKGVFSDLKASVNGFEFHYGVGGIHGSVERRKVVATEEYPIVDIDVAALYPSIAIVNNLAPEHLGAAFTNVYAALPQERKRWQKEKGKKCPEANALKLASNGVYGKSNSVFSPFFDPQFTMQITINGQLMLSMLAERLMSVPTLQLLQINTDGMTYIVHRDQIPLTLQIRQEWEALTRLVLEEVRYSRMWIRDCNNYVAQGIDGSLKLKGAYWSPDALNYHQSIADAQPVSWHKNFSNVVSVRAAVEYMVNGTNPSDYIRYCTNPYDFTCAVKVNRSDKLLWGGVEQNRNTRFYVATDGHQLIKELPPTGPLGSFKKANGVSDAEYARVMVETGGAWDERVCTKNKSVHQIRQTQIMARYNVQIVNDINKFDFSKINYDWYLQEALKLII